MKQIKVEFQHTAFVPVIRYKPLLIIKPVVVAQVRLVKS